MMKSMKKKPFILLTMIPLLLLVNYGLMAIEPSAKKRFLKETFLSSQICLHVGLNRFSADGADSDYMAGTNDFPVIPAYQSPAFGISCAFFTSRSFAVGVDLSYGLSTSVDLRDPADGETIQADTPKNLLAVFNLFQYFDLSRQMRLFVSLGGGAEYRIAEDREYQSDLGSRIIISAPAKPLSALVAIGMGMQYMFSAALGINLECQADCVFRDSAQLLISPVLALVFKF